MDRSPLQRLPPELRNYVYELVLAEDVPITVKKVIMKKDGQSNYFARATIDDPHALAITKTCKTMHAESAKLVFASNTFQNDFIDFFSHPDGGRTSTTSLGYHDVIRTSATHVISGFIGTVGTENAKALHSIVAKIDVCQALLYCKDLSGRNFPKATVWLKGILLKLRRLARDLPRWNVNASLRSIVHGCPITTQEDRLSIAKIAFGCAVSQLETRANEEVNGSMAAAAHDAGLAKLLISRVIDRGGRIVAGMQDRASRRTAQTANAG